MCNASTRQRIPVREERECRRRLTLGSMVTVPGGGDRAADNSLAGGGLRRCGQSRQRHRPVGEFEGRSWEVRQRKSISIDE